MFIPLSWSCGYKVDRNTDEYSMWIYKHEHAQKISVSPPTVWDISSCGGHEYPQGIQSDHSFSGVKMNIYVHLTEKYNFLWLHLQNSEIYSFNNSFFHIATF